MQQASPNGMPTPGSRSNTTPLKSELPIELATSVREVLERCGFDTGLSRKFWSKFAAFPNLRRNGTHLRPTSMHTPWRVLRREEVFSAPSLDTLSRDIASKITSGDVQHCRHLENDDEDEVPILSLSTICDLVLEITENSERRLWDSSIRLPCKKFVTPEVVVNSEATCRQLLNKHYSRSGLPVDELLATISPKGYLSETFLSSYPSLSVLEGLDADQRNGPCPLILWFVWPSTENHKLASCNRDTVQAVDSLDHGAFIVLLPGEGLLVPANSPYATFALRSNVDYSWDLCVLGAKDPPTPSLDASYITERVDACHSYLMDLGVALEDPKWRDRYIEHLAQTWTQTYMVMSGVLTCSKGCSEGCKEHSRTEFRGQMMEILVADMERTKECAVCVGTGIDKVGLLEKPDFGDRESMVMHLRRHGWVVPEGSDGQGGGVEAMAD